MKKYQKKSLFTAMSEEESATVSGGIVIAVSLPTGVGKITLGASYQSLKDKLNEQVDPNTGKGLADSFLDSLPNLKSKGLL